MLQRAILGTAVIAATAHAALAQSAQPATSYQARVQVTAPTRIDWVYALASQSPPAPPADWLPDYDSTQQSYERFVPPAYNPKQAYPLLLFISPSEQADGYTSCAEACQKLGIIFAGPHAAGNNCDARRRVRIVLDVLDQVRRDYHVDTDRTYIAGLSGGGRIACAVAFSLPEYFGGVLPICAAGDLRDESWLRHRVIDRLSVAHLTGETDFNRGEVERYRNPLLAAVGVRSRAWVVPGLGHTMPPSKWLIEALQWLDEGANVRGQLARRYPASRISRDAAPTRVELAQQLLSEAKQRLKAPKTRYSGLMQLKGVAKRWPNLPVADEAKRVLLTYEQGADQSWAEADVAEQRLFLIARARALDAYASGPLPPQYQKERTDMANAASQLWQMVIDDGQNAAAVAEAKRRLPELKRLVGGEGQ